MNYHLTAADIAKRFDENGIRFEKLQLQGCAFILVSARGGRVFGPFMAEGEESLLWVSGVLADSNTFRSFLKSGDWNLGGDRIWIAPEIQFYVADRMKYWETISVPALVDPGAYTLQFDGKSCMLSQRMRLPAYNLASGETELELTRQIKQVKDPLRSIKDYNELSKQVQFAGFEQRVTLRSESGQHIYAEAWNLSQLNPGGKIYICAVPALQYVDYYEPVTDEFMTRGANYVSYSVTGSMRYKIGLKSVHLFGRMAYLNRQDDGRSYLIVKNFFNNPSSVYSEEPPYSPGDNGYSIHVYNDDGKLGGFGEMECNAQTIGGDTGKLSSVDTITTCIYRGTRSHIEKILYQLTGITV